MPKNHTNQPKKKQFDAWNKVKKNINRRTGFLALHDKKFPLSSDRGVAGIPDNGSIVSHLRRKIKALFKHSHRRNRKHSNPRKGQ